MEGPSLPFLLHGLSPPSAPEGLAATTFVPLWLGGAVTVPCLLRRHREQDGVVPFAQQRQEMHGKDLPIPPGLGPFQNQKLLPSYAQA